MVLASIMTYAPHAFVFCVYVCVFYYYVYSSTRRDACLLCALCPTPAPMRTSARGGFANRNRLARALTAALTGPHSNTYNALPAHSSLAFRRISLTDLQKPPLSKCLQITYAPAQERARSRRARSPACARARLKSE